MNINALQERLVIDTHNDTIVLHLVYDRTSMARANATHVGHEGTISLIYGYASEIPFDGFQIDLPMMRKVGLDVGFFAVYVHTALGSRLAFALDGFGYLFADLEESPGAATIVRTTADIHKARQTGRTGIILAVEHADVLAGSLNVLRMLYEMGVRSIGFTHNISSRAAAGCAEPFDGVGLTHFGARLVREMNRLGMVVDLAHVSPQAFYDGLEISTRPIIFSHGNCRALCDHPRNLDDDQLRALGQQGGVIGLSFVPFFVDDSEPTLARFLYHVDHVIEMAGPQSVGLGSDFDGGGTLLKGVWELPSVVEGLCGRGYGDELIAAFLGGNMLRVLEQTIG